MLGDEGFTNGPNILKKVFNPNSLLIGATCFIAGWKRGAWRIHIPLFSIQLSIKPWSFENLIPKFSNTLLDPHDDETP